MIITTDIGGGMGNQMFMMAHCISQGWKYDKPSQFVLIDPGYVNRHPNRYVDNVYRNIEFVGGIPEPIVKIYETWGETPDISNLTTSNLFKGNIKFEGYFQGTKHFLGFDDKIRELFSPTDDFIHRMEILYPQIKDENTLSVHVRRGDYLSISNILPIVDISYINSSISQHGNYDTVFVFSDDKRWATQNILHPNVIIVDGLTDWEELWLMSLCKNNIICNSTFGWWSAFLNKNPNKKVYLPSLWFGPNAGRGLVHITISEPDWIQIPVEYDNGRLITK